MDPLPPFSHLRTIAPGKFKMNNRAKRILPLEGTYDKLVSEPPFMDPRIDKLQSEMGEMKHLLLQIHQQMKMMNVGNHAQPLGLFEQW